MIRQCHKVQTVHDAVENHSCAAQVLPGYRPVYHVTCVQYSTRPRLAILKKPIVLEWPCTTNITVRLVHTIILMSVAFTGSQALLLDATDYFANPDLSDVIIVIREDITEVAEPHSTDGTAEQQSTVFRKAPLREARIPGHKIILSAYSELFKTQVTAFDRHNAEGMGLMLLLCCCTACWRLP